MATNGSTIADQLKNLEEARKLVLGDATFYPQVVQGVLPIIGSNSPLELRRWGADFISEMLASPVIAPQQKESLSRNVLDTLKSLLESPDEDAWTFKSVVQACASLYPLLFRYIISNPADSLLWDQVSAIKSRIFRLWESVNFGVRVTCIKFVQKIIQCQTPGLIADPRRPEQNEVSLAIVPRNHPLIPPRNLEAEASGLLDRLLNILHESPPYKHTVLVNATLNCLSPLIRNRQSISNKIISALLNFDPFKQADASNTPAVKVMVKSMERTTRAVLVNFDRANPGGPLSGRIRQYCESLARARLDVLEESSRKRPAPVEDGAALDQVKRTRLGPDVAGTPEHRFDVPPLPAGPVSIAQLFTLTEDQALNSFDVQQLPFELLVQITPPVLRRLDHALLDAAINAIRSRYLSFTQTQQQPSSPSQNTGGMSLDEDDEDYEPDYQPAEDDEQIMNKLDAAPNDPYEMTTLGTFEMSKPPVMSQEETQQVGQVTIGRVFGAMDTSDDVAKRKSERLGINRLAANNYDRNTWVTILTRLATRSFAGLDDESNVKEENRDLAPSHQQDSPLTENLRQSLYIYVLEDFRTRIEIAVAWLNEEWYNDQVCLKKNANASRNYQYWSLKFLDGILPYLDARDKVFTRFLSEIPSIDTPMLDRVVSLARDPERVTLAVSTLHYLILLRPPVRDICIDAVENLYRNYDDAKTAASKVLTKWRPEALQSDPASTQAQILSKSEPHGSHTPSALPQNGVAVAT